MNFFEIGQSDLQMPNIDEETPETCDECDEPLETRMIDLDNTNLEEMTVCVNRDCENFETGL